MPNRCRFQLQKLKALKLLIIVKCHLEAMLVSVPCMCRALSFSLSCSKYSETLPQLPGPSLAP